jgi:hypothetical protein
MQFVSARYTLNYAQDKPEENSIVQIMILESK